MIANSRCIACNLSKKEEKIRKHSDEKKKKEFIQKVTGILYKYGDIESTPMLDKRIQDIYNEYYEEETDYVALKHKYNQYMLEREDEIKEHLKEAKNIKDYNKIIYVFFLIFSYLLKCPNSPILSAIRAFCFCGKPHISRSNFLYFSYQTWLKSW